MKRVPIVLVLAILCLPISVRADGASDADREAYERLRGGGTSSKLKQSSTLRSAGSESSITAPTLSTSISTYFIVKTSEFDGSYTYEVLSKNDYADKSKRLRKEGMLLYKAYTDARDRWEATHGDRFPLNRPSPRRISKTGRYSDVDKANEKLAEHLQRERERAAEDAEREELRWNRKYSALYSSGRRMGMDKRRAKAAAREKIAEERQREEESKRRVEKKQQAALAVFLECLNAIQADSAK